jgi:hypothetical protein
MKSMRIVHASIVLTCVGILLQAPAMELPTPSSESQYTISMSVGQACPLEKIAHLPGLEYLRYAEKLPTIEQGANSTVYKWYDQIIKISKIVDPSDKLSKKLDDLQKTYDMLSSLKNPGFSFAIPQKTYRIRSSDNKGMCFVEISAALPKDNKINRRFYEYIDSNRDNQKLFFASNPCRRLFFMVGLL